MLKFSRYDFTRLDTQYLVDILEKIDANAPGSLVGKVEAKNVVIAEKIDNLKMS